ncbi:Mitogen-activated protein kinase kinase kinase 1 like [Verticillium longisporum]|uniref:Mitogen-activated protein kinase kinase kinase 1 like n=1 Tax=Verticillium longisporum TaxID=100787 RepID=A0A8I2Z9K1_VERLO|nr:Mitogen-activated protein kinase kinase kinase 1 like [Verticillium longisporum]
MEYTRAGSPAATYLDARPRAHAASARQPTTHKTSSPARRGPSQNNLPAAAPRTPSSSRKRKAQPESPKSEKRQRRFRSQPPHSFYTIYERALSQRFYVIKREREGTAECPEESIELAGSTGNVYDIHVGQNSSCNCPHALQGNQCKHILYVMARVLRASFQHVYQLALLSSELREIFAAAPPIDSKDALDAAKDPSASVDDRRKPVEGDCPICFDGLDASSNEKVVWCRAACGQNIHRDCFQTWAKTKRQSEVTCPFCRSVWEGDEEMVKTIKGSYVNGEGYVNVADQLGISGVRDTSSYSRYSSRRRPWYGQYDDGQDVSFALYDDDEDEVYDAYDDEEDQEDGEGEGEEDEP